MRNRARGFSIMRLENNRLKAEVAKLQKTIDGYKNVQPGAAEGAGERGGSTGTEGTMQASLADLRSRAK